MNRLHYCIIFLLLSVDLPAQSVYDDTGSYVGRMNSGYYYGLSGKIVIMINGNYIYGSEGNLIGRTDFVFNHLYDEKERIIGRVDNNNYLYTATGALIGRIDDVNFYDCEERLRYRFDGFTNEQKIALLYFALKKPH